MELYIIISILMSLGLSLYFKLSHQPRDLPAELAVIVITLLAWPIVVLFLMYIWYLHQSSDTKLEPLC